MTATHVTEKIRIPQFIFGLVITTEGQLGDGVVLEIRVGCLSVGYGEIELLFLH